MVVKATEILGSDVERVTLGHAAADIIAREAERHNAGRVFLLVSRHLNTQTEEIEKIRRALGNRQGGTHHGIRAHVPKSDLLEAVHAAREARADLIVAVGGGSVADAGKILALCLMYDVRSMDDLNALRIQRAAAAHKAPILDGAPDIRIICVPTTLSAGEFNPLSGVTDEALGQKQGFTHPRMTPACVVLDPAITAHTPEWLWLSTGVRAVDHAVETLASLQSNDFADGLAASGLRLLGAALPWVKEQPQDLEARLKCQVGAWMSILPLISGVPMGASHAIGHALGGYCNVPHGHTSCVMAPYVQFWNAQAVPQRQQRISECLGSPGEQAHHLLDRLIRSLGMPRTLAEVGVPEAKLLQIAEYALQDRWGRTNPRPITRTEEMLEILRMAQGEYRDTVS